jgi:hypothetical protein
MELREFIAKTIHEYLNEQKNDCLPEGSFADALRKDLIEQFFKNISDDDMKEELSEEPNYDLLLEPDHYYGYDYQTYIQYIDDNTFKYYEGFSKHCWDGFKKQSQYKGKTKEQIISDFVNKRAKNLGLEFGYKLINSDFYIHNSWDYKDYILILTYSNK